jgi:hypothetical protein
MLLFVWAILGAILAVVPMERIFLAKEVKTEY